MKIIKLSIQQIKEMMHCCGNNPFSIEDETRNCFNTHHGNELWENLWSMGLAKKSFSDAYVNYHLTVDGFKVLREVFSELSVQVMCANNECQHDANREIAREGIIAPNVYCPACIEEKLENDEDVIPSY